MILMIRGVIEESRIQGTIRRFIHFFDPFRSEYIILRICHISINGLAIYIYNGSYVVNGLHSALYFEAVYTYIN
ncbi:hypothetical protein D3C81_949740 [compost metagenome]